MSRGARGAPRLVSQRLERTTRASRQLVAPASTTAAAPAESAATAAAPASKSATPTTAATRSFCLRACFIHGDVPIAKLLSVELRNSFVRLGVIGHFHEAETARLA